MKPSVLGVDPSMTATCLCSIVGGHVEVETSKTKPKTGTELEKLTRMRTQANAVVDRAQLADLVVIEGLSFSSKGAATRDLAGLWWLIIDRLADLNVPYAIASPPARAKWATGKGNASKFEVGQHISKRWPDVELRSDDEADGLVLASMALHFLGALPWTPTKPQDDALSKLTWPIGVAA